MSNGILTNSEKDKEVLIYLAKVNTCKTMQELDSIRKVVKEKYYRKHANIYFNMCSNRILKQQWILNNEHRNK